MIRGHALRLTGGKRVIRQGEEKAVLEGRRPVLPTNEEMSILRRAASGFIMKTMIYGEPQYSYEDGTPVSLAVNRRNGWRKIERMVKEGWLIPDKGDSLFEDDPKPQIYRARKP